MPKALRFGCFILGRVTTGLDYRQRRFDRVLQGRNERIDAVKEIRPALERPLTPPRSLDSLGSDLAEAA